MTSKEQTQKLWELMRLCSNAEKVNQAMRNFKNQRAFEDDMSVHMIKLASDERMEKVEHPLVAHPVASGFSRRKSRSGCHARNFVAKGYLAVSYVERTISANNDCGSWKLWAMSSAVTWFCQEMTYHLGHLYRAFTIHFFMFNRRGNSLHHRIEHNLNQQTSGFPACP